MKLSLKVKSEPVVLTDASGKDQNWELREMVASERDSYMDTLGDRIELTLEGEVKSIKKVSGMHTDLLKRTLFLNGIVATEQQINSWPASVTSELFKAAQVLNGLSKPAEESKADAKKG